VLKGSRCGIPQAKVSKPKTNLDESRIKRARARDSPVVSLSPGMDRLNRAKLRGQVQPSDPVPMPIRRF